MQELVAVFDRCFLSLGKYTVYSPRAVKPRCGVVFPTFCRKMLASCERMWCNIAPLGQSFPTDWLFSHGGTAHVQSCYAADAPIDERVDEGPARQDCNAGVREMVQARVSARDRRAG